MIKKLQQISAYGCELSMRILLCQDAIFHRIPVSSDIGMQKTPLIMQKKIACYQIGKKMTCG